MSADATATPFSAECVDKQVFRRVCSRFTSGITITTVLDEAGRVHGLTANSFTSVSLTPPIVLICVDKRSKVLEHFRQQPFFGINILAEHQKHLSDRFAGSGYGRFEGVTWHPGKTGVPLLPGNLATLECARIDVVEAGDHDIFLVLLGHKLNIFV